MQTGKIRQANGEERIGFIEGDAVRLLRADMRRLSDFLHGPRPSEALREAVDAHAAPLARSEVQWLAPLDMQEVWAAGVTYKRSEEARKRESVGAARFYDLVYSADRPELFFKAPAWRVAGPGAPIQVRRDSRWSVPEPELALVLSPRMELVGFTIGNDVSARDIEGENPLYLPQAKVYDNACALGPVVTLTDAMPSPEATTIRLTIERSATTVFEGSTNVAAIARPFAELIGWLGKEISFPHGAVLLTGTGVVPPDDFTLAAGDQVHIDITGIGRLSNPVTQKAPLAG